MSHPSSAGPRRYFWGNSLRQALSLAARHHQIAPEELGYRTVEKRHGFVRQPRRVLIEVDPAAPRRQAAGRRDTSSATFGSAAPAAPPSASSPSARRAGEARERGEAPARPPATRPAAARRAGPGYDAPVAPDEESALAATVATGRLLRFAGLELEVTVERLPERLDLKLSGKDEQRLRELGAPFLEHLGHLLPRLVKSLSGRLVLCRIDGAGIRSEREEELRAMALAAGASVVETGMATLLEPLGAADRRIVHLALADDDRLTTESVGQGVEKRVRVALAASNPAP